MAEGPCDGPFRDGLLSIINLYTKYKVSMFTHYEDMKGGEKYKNWYKNWGNWGG